MGVSIYNELKNKELEGVDLICTIIDYILGREKSEKVDRLVIPEMALKSTNPILRELEKKAYSNLEQSHRLLQKELKRTSTFYQTIENKQVNAEYNEIINLWVEEHPFRLDNSFQNIVFESYALAQVMGNGSDSNIIMEYLNTKYKGSYLLFLFYDKVIESRDIDPKYINSVYKSLKEIESPSVRTEMVIESVEASEDKIEGEIDFTINIGNDPISYCYNFKIDSNEPIELGGNLGSISIS